MAGSADDFLRAVLRSALMTRDQLQAALRPLSVEVRASGEALAQHLILAGLLTPFQVQKLQQGITRGLVLGPYSIEVPIGRGGMGTVYLARDHRDGQHVALKVLPPKWAREEERRLARFQREMTLSQRVRHQHLALFLEAGVYEDIHYIAFEYIPGRTLYRLVSAEGPLAVPRAARLFAEIAQALDQAHAVGLIHRDLKPSNLMVTPNDHAKVLDLGLAFLEGEAAVDLDIVGGKGYVVGSVDYMAPEQTRDATAVDARSDLYALGCCLYFALTGRPPFPGGTTKEKVQAHRGAEPLPIAQSNAQVPEAFAALVGRLMAKVPAERFTTALEVEHALREWCPPSDERPVEAADDSVTHAAVLHALAGEAGFEPADPRLFKRESEPREPLTRSQRLLWWLVLGLSACSLLCLLGLGVAALVR